jgi:serine protease Do
VSAAKLRAEIGDEEFEQYLEALGRPTSVLVGTVEPSSAAANGGLLPGDQIVAYAGQRVFNARDLSALTQQRGIGETVPATVVRDGQRLQLYVTGGPLGLVPARVQH